MNDQLTKRNKKQNPNGINVGKYLTVWQYIRVPQQKVIGAKQKRIKQNFNKKPNKIKSKNR